MGRATRRVARPGTPSRHGRLGGGARTLIAVGLFALALGGVRVLNTVSPAKLPATYDPPVMGRADAPVTVTLYTDFGCSACADFVTKGFQQALIERFVQTGKVKLVFRNFLFTGPPAQIAAEGAGCANAQGRFWEYERAYFERRPQLNVDNVVALTEQVAGDAGLDRAAFTACLEARTYRPGVVDDALQVKQMGIKNAPLITVNARRFEGAQPVEVLAPAIETELAQSGR